MLGAADARRRPLRCAGQTPSTAGAPPGLTRPAPTYPFVPAGYPNCAASSGSWRSGPQLPSPRSSRIARSRPVRIRPASLAFGRPSGPAVLMNSRMKFDRSTAGTPTSLGAMSINSSRLLFMLSCTWANRESDSSCLPLSGLDVECSMSAEIVLLKAARLAAYRCLFSASRARLSSASMLRIRLAVEASRLALRSALAASLPFLACQRLAPMPPRPTTPVMATGAMLVQSMTGHHARLGILPR
jgi:hypothetical protein